MISWLRTLLAFALFYALVCGVMRGEMVSPVPLRVDSGDAHGDQGCAGGGDSCPKDAIGELPNRPPGWSAEKGTRQHNDIQPGGMLGTQDRGGGGVDASTAHPTSWAESTVIRAQDERVRLSEPVAPAARHRDTLYDASFLALITGTFLDIASSYGAQEANPLMRSSDGRLGGKAVAINVGFLGALVAAKIIGKDMPPKWQRRLTVLNFGVAGWRTGCAVRNWSR